MSDKTFTLLATVDASTKRRPTADNDDLFDVPSSSISSLDCTPLDPVTAEKAMELGIGSGAPFSFYQTFVQGGQDIIAGDVLTVSSVDYDIRAIEPYKWTPDSNAVYSVLYLEKAET